MKSTGLGILIVDVDGIGSRVGETRKLRGLTQDGLALLIPCSKSLISQVERGAKPATPWFVAAVARALRIDVTGLTGQPYRGTTERTDRAHAGIPEIRLAMNHWVVPPDLEATPRPLDVLRTDIRFIGRLLDSVDYIALGRRLPGLIEELAAVLHDSDGRRRREAARLLTHAFVAAKSVAYRLGYIDLVSVAVERAEQAAQVTQDPELLAFIAEERCQVFFASAAYHSGLKFLRAAHRVHDDTLHESEPGLAVAGSMHLRAAIMAARLGAAGRSEAWAHIGQAQEYATRIGRDTDHYGLIFGPANVHIHEVATAIELEDADEALRRDEGFDPPPGLAPERSSHHYIDVARARLLTGDRGRALKALIKADRLSPQHTRHHPMARETVAGLLRAHSRAPESLRSLAQRLGVKPR
ncbi:helix-turn-helix transcriptional regulator [Sphaerisporangium sp. NPDC005289]|uniref:helix-turn-helix domain-containing protein n=1 Tax=Sphaerisporangium sp. NPDC005289 TaxID=3155247 RepID=UPI0033B463AC